MLAALQMPKGWRHRIALASFILISLGGLLLAPPGSGIGRWSQSAYAGVFDSTPGVALRQLPPQVRDTLELARRGGPFPYPHDGVRFGNYEKRLPAQAREYYKEYTVPTPGARDRGARRVIMGAGGEAYYTDDHYNTFRRIIP